MASLEDKDIRINKIRNYDGPDRFRQGLYVITILEQLDDDFLLIFCLEVMMFLYHNS